MKIEERRFRFYNGIRRGRGEKKKECNEEERKKERKKEREKGRRVAKSNLRKAAETRQKRSQQRETLRSLPDGAHNQYRYIFPEPGDSKAVYFVTLFLSI